MACLPRTPNSQEIFRRATECFRREWRHLHTASARKTGNACSPACSDRSLLRPQQTRVPLVLLRQTRRLADGQKPRRRTSRSHYTMKTVMKSGCSGFEASKNCHEDFSWDLHCKSIGFIPNIQNVAVPSYIVICAVCINGFGKRSLHFIHLYILHENLALASFLLETLSFTFYFLALKIIGFCGFRG